MRLAEGSDAMESLLKAPSPAVILPLDGARAWDLSAAIGPPAEE